MILYPFKRDVLSVWHPQWALGYAMLPRLGSWRRELSLEGNKIGDAGAEKLAAALPSMPKLEDTL